MDNILISIIIPVYNVENYIQKCLESIIIQKTNEIEVLCINDGSIDRSGDICEEYAKRDKRIKVFHKENGGVASARNLGLKNANGKYIAWVDPDDFISPNWYETLSKVLYENRDIDVVFFNFSTIENAKIKEWGYDKESKRMSGDEFLKELSADRKIQNHLWSKVIKYNLFEGIVFPENLRTFEDYAVIYRVLVKAKTVYYLAKYLYFYRIRNNSLVHELSFNEDYQQYLLSKREYTYLISKGKDITKMMYLTKDINICLKYCLDKDKLTQEEQEKYLKCKKELNANYVYVLKTSYCRKMIKVYCSFLKIDKLKFLLTLKNFLKLIKSK